jgi:hypothetical protein
LNLCYAPIYFTVRLILSFEEKEYMHCNGTKKNVSVLFGESKSEKIPMKNKKRNNEKVRRSQLEE